MRRLITQRDGSFCNWKACFIVDDLEIHHLVYQAFGGRFILSNLCLLCANHHAQIHKFSPVPGSNGNYNIKPHYLLAWQAMYSVLGRGFPQ